MLARLGFGELDAATGTVGNAWFATPAGQDIFAKDVEKPRQVSKTGNRTLVD